jgi:hypothetical protein
VEICKQKAKFQEVEGKYFQVQFCHAVLVKLCLEALEIRIWSFNTNSGWLQKLFKLSSFYVRQQTDIAHRLPNVFEQKMLAFWKYQYHSLGNGLLDQFVCQ